MEAVVGTGSSGSRAISNTVGSNDDGFRHVKGFTTGLHQGRQGKHIVGHNNYQAGKSIIYGGIQEAQALISEGAGKGIWHAPNKETVSFDHTIGIYISENGDRSATTMGTIHYSKDGAHIVPSKPKGEI